MINKIINIFIYMLSHFTIRKKNRIIFGSWFGKKYDDNSRYLFEYMIEKNSNKKEYELIWIGYEKPNLQLNKNIIFAKKDSIKSIYYILTAKYAIMTQGYEDFYKYNLLGKSIKVQLWHGIPIKKIGKPQLKDNKVSRLIRQLMYSYDYFIASSSEHKKKMEECFYFIGANEENVLKIGQPRNDYIIKNNNTEYIEQLKNKYGFPKNKIIVTYMPTFRDNMSTNFSFSSLKEKDAEFFYKNNILILEKQHSTTNVEKSFIVVADNKMTTQDILLISDILITDYSSVYLDYLLRNKPILHYVYDKEYYINSDRGLLYNFDDVRGGKEVYTFDELKKRICEYINNPNIDNDRRESLRIKFLNSEIGESCAKLISKIGLEI